VWLGMINNPNGTVGWGLSRNEWVGEPTIVAGNGWCVRIAHVEDLHFPRSTTDDCKVLG